MTVISALQMPTVLAAKVTRPVQLSVADVAASDAASAAAVDG